MMCYDPQAGILSFFISLCQLEGNFWYFIVPTSCKLKVKGFVSIRSPSTSSPSSNSVRERFKNQKETLSMAAFIIFTAIPISH